MRVQFVETDEDLHILFHGLDRNIFETAVGILVACAQVRTGETALGQGGAVRAAAESDRDRFNTA